MINKTVDITVTSVHQTTAGKMIFGRLDERSEPQGSRGTQAHAIHDIPRSVESASRQGEALAGGERLPRPVVPDPSRESE
jgi:hypothetical protein